MKRIATQAHAMVPPSAAGVTAHNQAVDRAAILTLIEQTATAVAPDDSEDWRAMERQHVVRLLDDMRRSATDLKRSNDWVSRQVADQRVLLSALKACEVNENQRTAVARGLWDLGKFEFAVIDRQLINRLRASGQFGIIKNPEVRSPINIVVQSSDNQMRVEPTFGAAVHPLIAYARRFYYFDVPETSSACRWDNLRFDIKQVCQDFELISAIGTTRQATRNLHNWNAAILTQVKAAETALFLNLLDRSTGLYRDSALLADEADSFTEDQFFQPEALRKALAEEFRP